MKITTVLFDTLVNAIYTEIYLSSEHPNLQDIDSSNTMYCHKSVPGEYQIHLVL